MRTCSTKFRYIFGFGTVQKRVNLVDLVKSCPNFHFSVSPHVPFLNLLLEQIANSNEYLLANIGVDTAENKPLKVCQKLAKRSKKRVRTNIGNHTDYNEGFILSAAIDRSVLI